MEESPGLAEKMVRTKTKKAPRANKQKAGTAKREGAEQMGKLADDGLAEECAKLVSPVVEKALTGDKNYLQQFVSFAHKTRTR